MGDRSTGGGGSAPGSPISKSQEKTNARTTSNSWNSEGMERKLSTQSLVHKQVPKQFLVAKEAHDERFKE